MLTYYKREAYTYRVTTILLTFRHFMYIRSRMDTLASLASNLEYNVK